MKNLKQRKGITLIALVLTIIVLLILAGITINLTIGQDGILRRAQEAGVEHEKAQLKEELELAILDIRTEKLSQGKSMTREDLLGLEKIGAIMESTGTPAEGEYKDYFFEVDEDYVVTIIGKLKGEKPSVQAEVITQGIVEQGGKVEIKVTASISEGNITEIVATNEAVLKTDTSATEKVFEVSANGTYKFKAKADNGRSASTSVEVNNILEAPQISIKNKTFVGFTIEVNNYYAEGLITEYKYYVGGELKSPANTTTKEYEVTGLTEDTEYENIYVEAYVNTVKMTSNIVTATTLSEWSEAYTSTVLNNYEDKSGKKATIPAGYQVSLKTGQTEIETGLVIRNATDKNEFVWVPCTLDGANGSIKYDRYSFGSFSNSAYSETIPSDEQTSVNTYGGYYIGRYESGVAGYDEEVATSNSNNLEEWTGYSNGKLVIKANQQVWNYITRDKAKNVSEGLYSKEKGDTVNSKLCSSYAWDTALKFIDTKNAGYSTNSTQGNYSDKSAQLGKPAKTGKTIAVNNIYDMGGNTWEWTTEASSYASAPCTTRGGCYNGSASATPAAYRNYSTRTYAYDALAFRTTLYL